jgi:outer membrane protein OmpA-like peptidoglycan-associated protein
MESDMRHLMTKGTVAMTATAALVALSACSSAPRPDPNLDQARTAYDHADNDANVVKYAPLELQQAKQALSTAEDLWRRNEDRADVDHYAELAKTRSAIAEETAKAKVAQAQVSTAAIEKKAGIGQGPTVMTLNDVLFNMGGATLQPGAFRQIDDLATYLKQHRDRTVTIEGYTDSTGSEATNEALSQRRADAVRDALIQRGVQPSRVIARGLGASSPIATNSTAAGRQLNRRVEAVVSGANEQGAPGTS